MSEVMFWCCQVNDPTPIDTAKIDFSWKDVGEGRKERRECLVNILKAAALLRQACDQKPLTTVGAWKSIL